MSEELMNNQEYGANQIQILECFYNIFVIGDTVWSLYKNIFKQN